MDDEVPHKPTLTSNTAVIGGVSTTTSQGYNAIDELTSLNGSTAGLSYDADGNQKTNPGNSAVGVAAVTASTVNGRDQITAATLGSGAHTTAGYLGETQTTLLTANNGVFTTSFTRPRPTGDTAPPPPIPQSRGQSLDPRIVPADD